MNDLISRQAALKKLAVYIHLIDKTMGKGTLTDDDCMEAAKSVLGEDELPAVQPDHTADIGKKVSISCGRENDVIFRKAAIDAVVDEFKRSPTPAIRAKLRLEALPPAQPEQRWIPSGERPPEEGSYLVWMPFAPPEERIAVADYCDGYWNIKTPISAWMPLPEPYRGGGKE